MRFKEINHKKNEKFKTDSVSSESGKQTNGNTSHGPATVEEYKPPAPANMIKQIILGVIFF